MLGTGQAAQVNRALDEEHCTLRQRMNLRHNVIDAMYIGSLAVKHSASATGTSWYVQERLKRCRCILAAAT